MRREPRRGLSGLRQAFDEVRFGAARTLNLRESLPTGAAATARTEAWLRQAQVDSAAEVLIVTGRGNNSEGGVAVVRESVVKLLHQLKRRGVVAGFQEHTAGSFVVSLAPIRMLWEAPHRKNGRGPKPPAPTPPSLDALDADTRALLRELAERSLYELGIRDTEAFLDGEMLRQFSAIARSIEQGSQREQRLRAAIRAAVEQRD